MLPSPKAPLGYHYVSQDLPGGQYISTGWFPEGTVGRRGTGRTVQNCAGVGTLMFDIDCVSVITAARVARGQVVEAKVAGRKEHMYALRDELIDRYKGWMHDELLPTMATAMGLQPTTVVDTGWGFHLHYRVAADVAQDVAGLQKVAQLAITEANRLCMELGRGLKQPLVDLRPWDNTHDVGARLCRVPGTLNTKAAGKPRRCDVTHGGDPHSVVDRARCGDIQRRLGAPLFDIPERTRPARPTTKEVDFRREVMPDGRSWQAIVEALGPGDVLKVVCPYGGNSVGSGWFTRERDGKRARYNSSITNETVWNSYKGQPRSNGRAILLKTPKGAIVRSLTNLEHLLTQDARFNLWYDLFTERVMNNNEAVDDGIIMWTRLYMEQDYGWFWQIADQKLWQLIELVAKKNARNPLVDWLNSLKWDGQSRADRLLIEGCGVEDDKVGLHRAYGRRFLTSMAARALEPGCKVDTSLVLTGPQGWGKSSFFRELVDIDALPGLFTDTRFDIQNKDSMAILYSCWIYEDAEMVGQSRASNEMRKAFLSSQVDRYRQPYARTVRAFKRHNVIVSSTNSTHFLTDYTGSRRYWVVSVGDSYRKTDRLDREWLRRNRHQLLAEAVHLYRQCKEKQRLGQSTEYEQWWLSPKEEAARGRQNRIYEYKDWFAQCAEDVFNTNSGGKDAGITVQMFAAAIPHMGKTPANPQRDGKKLRIALLNAGFEYTDQNRWRRTYYRRDIQSDQLDDGLHILDAKPVGDDSPVKLMANRR